MVCLYHADSCFACRRVENAFSGWHRVATDLNKSNMFRLHNLLQAFGVPSFFFVTPCTMPLWPITTRNVRNIMFTFNALFHCYCMLLIIVYGYMNVKSYIIVIPNPDGVSLVGFLQWANTDASCSTMTCMDGTCMTTSGCASWNCLNRSTKHRCMLLVYLFTSCASVIASTMVDKQMGAASRDATSDPCIPVTNHLQILSLES